MRPTAEIADEFGTQARELYETDGVVMPMIAFLTDTRHVICGVLPDAGYPADVFGQITYALSKPLRAELIVYCVEGWCKSYEPNVKPMLNRGDLSRMRDEGDETITTSLISCVLDVRSPSQSTTVHSRVASPEGVRPVEWDIHADAGKPEGFLTDNILAAHRQTVLTNFPWELCLTTLGKLGLIGECHVVELEETG